MARVGTGATLTLPEVTTNKYEILSITLGGQRRETIDTTHLGTTTARTHKPVDLYEPGEVSIEVQWENTDPKMDYTFDVTAGTQVLTFAAPTTTAPDVFTAIGMLRDFDLQVPLEDKMTATVVYKLSGATTWA